MYAVRVPNFQNARIREIFRGFLFQKLPRKITPLNFRVGQIIRRLRRRANRKQKNYRSSRKLSRGATAGN